MKGEPDINDTLRTDGPGGVRARHDRARKFSAPPKQKAGTPTRSGDAVVPLPTITPAAWKGTEPEPDRWFARNRILPDDLAILTGDGGVGKTEIALQLCIFAAAGLGDWLGCTIENGLTLFFSAEEAEAKLRKRAIRICKHRGIDLDAIDNLHMHFPDLEDSWLVSEDRKTGRMQRTPLMNQLEKAIETLRPRLVVIDNVAAVFDGDAITRRQVRPFCSILRKIARQHQCAILLLDHPSIRGRTDGTGTANSVDWRNGPRSMLYLFESDKDDPDERTLEVKKNNDGPIGEKTKMRWNGLTFSTAAVTAASPHKAKAEREIDDLFLRLLDKRNAQGRPVRPSRGPGHAPAEFAVDPEANGVAAKAFATSMDRLYDAGQIITKETGPASRRFKHIERAT